MASKSMVVPRSFAQVVASKLAVDIPQPTTADLNVPVPQAAVVDLKAAVPQKWADVNEDHDNLERSPSECSLSTVEGASTSGCSSSSPAGSEGAMSLPTCDEKTSPSVAHTQPSSHAAAPLWVDNGLKGDAAAWLLVVSKGGMVPKSPNDAVILGPYVTTKNTFLEESRVGGSIMSGQRQRARSWGASR